MGKITLNVALPEELDTYLKERVTEGRYDSPGDYIHALIREDREAPRSRNARSPAPRGARF
jgi:Arc/MetJ-type ribon-helix-helix transcriptional regulator